MKIDTLGVLQFVRGDTYGLPKSVLLHSTCNIVGDFECGENCRIDGGVTITGRVRLGDNVHIATGARLFGAHGIDIGNNCGVGPGSTLLTACDDPDGDMLALHKESDLKSDAIKGAIFMDDYSIITAHCVVLPGAVIKREVILGALSLVPAWETLDAGRIYAGIPCVEIRNRPKLRYTK